MAGQQVTTWKRPAGQRELRVLHITWLEHAGGEVARHQGQGILGVADNHGVGVGFRFVRHQRNVRATQ